MSNVKERTVPTEYAMAYVEILEILSRIDDFYYKKIPPELLERFKKFKSRSYEFKYEDSKELKEQKLMPKTKEILAVLFIDYFSTEEEKAIIEKKQKEFKIRKEQKLQKKYNSSKLFESRKKEVMKEEDKYIVEYKESFFQKIISKIGKMIYRK